LIGAAAEILYAPSELKLEKTFGESKKRGMLNMAA
jgi:hypothetical protein